MVSLLLTFNIFQILPLVFLLLTLNMQLSAVIKPFLFLFLFLSKEIIFFSD